MRVIDASSIVHAWDNYPIEQFPRLWAWLEADCSKGDLRIPRPAMDEVSHVCPDCALWLRAVGTKIMPITNDVLIEATRIKGQLGIANDRYHPKGVDENDLLIIASARIAQSELISNEAKQPTLPSDTKQYKIPAVCIRLAPPPAIDFLDHVKGSGLTFG